MSVNLDIKVADRSNQKFSGSIEATTQKKSTHLGDIKIDYVMHEKVLSLNIEHILNCQQSFGQNNSFAKNNCSEPKVISQEKIRGTMENNNQLKSKRKTSNELRKYLS